MAFGAQGTAFVDQVTDAGSTQLYPLRFPRWENGKMYRYMKATTALTVNQAAALDTTTDNTGNNVRPTAAVTDMLFGVAETAILINNFGWITVMGVASCKIATAATAGQFVSPSATAGVLINQTTAGNDVNAAMALEAGAAANLAKNIYLTRG